MLYHSMKLRTTLLFVRRTLSELVQTSPNKNVAEIIDTRDIHEDEAIDTKYITRSVLEEGNEDISLVAPYLKPSFNFAAYVNKSETLQQFIKLGVNLHVWEKQYDVPQYILQLNFERDVQKHLLFLSDLGVPADEFPRWLTKNPFIFKEDLDNLLVRIDYLKSKRFTNEMITNIITKNPFWLIFSTQSIDQRLGFFQKQFGLQGSEVRSLATYHPKVITYKLAHIKLNTFALKEEMGFTRDQLKSILLNKAHIFMKSQRTLTQTFEFVYRNMKIPLERIVEFPGVLTCRVFKLKQRHTFLKQLGKDQYDANLPNYVSLQALVSGTDADFCTEVAKSSIQAFNTFLKTE